MTEWHKKGFVISTEKEWLNTDLIHQFLSEEAFWSKGISKEVVMQSIMNSNL